MAMDTSQLAFPKGRTKRSLKAKATRQETKIKKSVRQQVMDRDLLAHCRLGGSLMNDVFDAAGGWMLPCAGPLEWCHAHSHRRSQTRKQAPQKRHTTAGSFAACAGHHQQYDAHQIIVTCLTRLGFDGPIKVRKAKS